MLIMLAQTQNCTVKKSSETLLCEESWINDCRRAEVERSTFNVEPETRPT
jgi:hypothetical protein